MCTMNLLQPYNSIIETRTRISREPLVSQTSAYMQNERTGGQPFTAHIKHRTVALIRTEILREIGVAFFLGHPVELGRRNSIRET
jgi:hypothetical protein